MNRNTQSRTCHDILLLCGVFVLSLFLCYSIDAFQFHQSKLWHVYSGSMAYQLNVSWSYIMQTHSHAHKCTLPKAQVDYTHTLVHTSKKAKHSELETHFETHFFHITYTPPTPDLFQGARSEWVATCLLPAGLALCWLRRKSLQLQRVASGFGHPWQARHKKARTARKPIALPKRKRNAENPWEAHKTGQNWIKRVCACMCMCVWRVS